ncbi:MAG: hypothetical protein ACE5MM_11240 [Nitrospiraceae bacterium]
MKPTKSTVPEWTTQDGEWYNKRLKRNAQLAREKRARVDARLDRVIANRVASPTRALLDFLYADLEEHSVQDISKSLKQIFDYSSVRGLGARFKVNPISWSAKDLRRAQAALHRGVAQLVLLDEDETGHWRLPKIEMVLDAVRSGYSLWALGPEVTSNPDALTPRWMRIVYPASLVLVDAMPWLRFCKLCGRLFFQVKVQKFCSEEHSKISYGRQRKRKTKRDPHGRPQRGRPLKDYTSEIESTHTAWLNRMHRR